MGTIKAGLSTNHRQRVVSLERWMYFCNGYDYPYTWDTLAAAAVRAGKAGPAAAPTVSNTSTAGTIASGVHLVQYRYNDQTTDWPSERSAQATISVPGDESLDIVVAPSEDARVDEVIVEMTPAGGTTMYEAGRFTNTTGPHRVNLTDAALQAAALDYDETGHLRPPSGRILLPHRSRMFYAGPEEHAVGTCSCAGTTSTIAFVGGDIRSSLVDYYWHRTGDPAIYRVSEVTATGAGGTIKLEGSYTSAFTSAAYSLIPRNPNRAYASKAGYPESVPTLNYEDLLKGSGDTLKALISWNESVIAFGEWTTEVWDYELDPFDSDDARVYSVPGRRGTLNAECVLEYDGVIYAMDRKGVYRWRGGVPETISKPVQDILKDANYSDTTKFHIHIDPIKRQLVCFLVYSSETETKTAIVYDIDRGRWQTHYYDNAITAGQACPDGDGYERPFVGSEYGATWFAGIGYSDGVKPGTTMVGTVDAGATTTSVPITEAGLYISNQKLAGVPFYYKESGEFGYVTSNTADTLILGAALASAPAAGHTVMLGRIRAEHKSKMFRCRPFNDQRELFLAVDFTPTSTAHTIRVKCYEDGSATAKSDWVAATETPGVTFQQADAEILIDSSTGDGHVEIPLATDWKKAISFEFIVDEPNMPFELIRYYLKTEEEQLVES